MTEKRPNTPGERMARAFILGIFFTGLFLLCVSALGIGL